MTKKNFPKTYEPTTIDLFERKMCEAGYTPTTPGQHEAFLCALLQAESTPPTLEDFLALLDIASEVHALVGMLEATGADMASVVRRGILAELQHYQRRQSRQEALADLDLSDPANRARRLGAGYAHLQQVLQSMMHDNLQAREWYERRYITAERLAKRAGSNPRLCREFLAERLRTLQEHHEAMGWHTVEAGHSHNHRAGNTQRDMARELRKTARHEQALLADMAEVV